MGIAAGSGRRAFARSLALCLLLAPWWSGCSSERPRADPGGAESSRGGQAVLGSPTDVDSWNEYVSQQSFAGLLLRRLYLRLADETGAAIDDDATFTPSLAESWSFSDDGLELTFVLREAVWSDGHPITADDVHFTWQAQTDPAVPWVGAANKSRIRDVEALDPRRVRFRFDGVYPYRIADAVEGGIVPRHRFGRVPFTSWATHDWSAEPIASGPFLLARHVRGQQIDLVRNPTYASGTGPRLDRVIVRIVPDDLSLLTQLEAGELDWLDGLPPREAHRLAADPAGHVGLVIYDDPRYDFVGWNTSRRPLDDPAVRRALTQAIDREALVEELLYGYGRVARGPLPSSWPGAQGALEPWPHDPEAARRLLAGRGVSLTLLTNAGNQLRRDVAVKIQEQLARVGVAVEIRVLEMKALREQVAAGDFDAYLGGWKFLGKVDLRSLFGSDRIPPVPGGLNVVRYRSVEADRLIDAIEAAPDGEALRAPLERLLVRLHEDQPYTFLYEPRRAAGHSRRLRGVRVDRPSDPLARLEELWVESP